MVAPFAGPYTVYPHGGVYAHPSTPHMAFPVNQELPAMFLPCKDREEKNSTVVDRHPVSVGNSNARSEECPENGESNSGTKEDGSSTDSIDAISESGGSKLDMSRSSTDLPNSERNAAPSIYLDVNPPCATSTGRQLVPVPLPNQTPLVELKTSFSSKVKAGGTPLLPTSSAKEEREMKREKRKQSNRESARRSRLRKQAETEEFAVKVGNLTAENSALRSEITYLTESSKKLRLDNCLLMEKLKLRQLNQAQDKAPAMVIENFLARIDNTKHAGGSNLFEDRLRRNPTARLINSLTQIAELIPCLRRGHDTSAGTKFL
ncbi:hypothetical protein KSP40_PGU005945 [Platanthera guangdongensis]|uniref:BZIP domain-containing protein n=1 Tax=Platanthera guangdongensis TaxID=2320717 RepID=A0ABR2LIU1_9ASPA